MVDLSYYTFQEGWGVRDLPRGHRT